MASVAGGELFTVVVCSDLQKSSRGDRPWDVSCHLRATFFRSSVFTALRFLGPLFSNPSAASLSVDRRI